MNLINYLNKAAYIIACYLLVSCAAGVDNTGVEYAPQMYVSVPYEGLSQVTDKEAGRWLTSSAESDPAEFYSSNPNNPYNMNMRTPAANTVRRNGPLPYRIPKDSLALAARTLVNPLEDNDQVLAEGLELYTRFCVMCHGATGMGDGLVGKVFKGVPSYTSRAVKDKPEGHLFHVITMGKGRMGSYASQVDIEERWKIVRYVQTLQNQ